MCVCTNIIYMWGDLKVNIYEGLICQTYIEDRSLSESETICSGDF